MSSSHGGKKHVLVDRHEECRTFESVVKLSHYRVYLLCYKYFLPGDCILKALVQFILRHLKVIFIVLHLHGSSFMIRAGLASVPCMMWPA